MNRRPSHPFQKLAAVVAATAACALVTPARAGDAAASGVRTVGIDKNGDLVLRLPGSVQRALAHGGAARATPVFSSDGSRIAFVQGSDPHVARAALVVVGLDGHELARVLIEPLVADLNHAGMRYVEAIRWLTRDRLVVRGSINPSQSQYYAIDVTTGRIADDTIDDTSSAAWSPDALHVATTTGAPHFEADEDRAPAIEIDHRVVYPISATRDIALVTAPQWSADGHSLGWVVLHRADKTLASVVWRDGSVRETRLGRVAADAAFGSFWSGPRLTVTESPADAPELASRAWAVESGTSRAIALTDAVDPLRDARLQRGRLVGEAMEAGLVQPDVWCAQCPLSKLPRASD